MYKQIGKYEIIEELGHGGQATVYKAKDTSLDGKIVALKVLEIPGGKDKSEKITNAYKRFKREAELTSKLDHPQIAQVFDYGLDEEKEIAFIARQYLHGEQLTELIKHGPLEYEDGFAIIISIAKVLDYLHKQGVVHRDIKPSNIFMQYDIPMLIDFGLAYREDQTILSVSDQMAGTMHYLSPEMVDWEKRDNYRYHPCRDWWGLGCIAFELFTGQRLFKEDESTLLESDIRQGREQVEIDNALKTHPAYQLVKGLLERNPEKRIASAGELRKRSKEEKSQKISISKPELIKPVGSVQEVHGVKGDCIRTLCGHSSSVISVAFSPNGATLASGSEDKKIKLWVVSSGIHIFTLSGHSNSVRSVAFSPDGATLASGSVDNTIKLWSVSSGECFRTLSEHSSCVESVAFSPDGTTLASGSLDDKIKLWSVLSRKCIRTLSGHSSCVESVTFSPDGATLASGSKDKTIKFWSVSSGECFRTLSGHSSCINSVAFSPDGATLASGSNDDIIKLWSVSRGECIHTLSEHSLFVNSVAFSPDGSKLASGNADKTIKLLRVK